MVSPDGTELRASRGLSEPLILDHLVNVVRQFAKLDGVRVVVNTETVARLKFAGTARMDVRFDYESINGRPVSLAARQAVPGSLTR